MTPKTKITIRNILLAAALTFVYANVTLYGGTALASLCLTFFGAGDTNYPLGVLYILPAAVTAFADIKLYKPLVKLFGHPAWVYTVQSGNLWSLLCIYFLIAIAASEYFPFAILISFGIGASASCLIGGTAVNFIFQTIRLSCCDEKRSSK